MGSLEGKKILFFSQFFFGYENKIAQAMRDEGAYVQVCDEMSVKSSYERAFLKINPHIFDKKTERYFLDLLEKLSNTNFDFVLFIDGEMVTKKILKMYRKAFPNAKFCLHLWDSVRNLKGVDKVFSFFDFITSFDSEDCKKYKLKFRPLFFCDEYRNIESDNKSYDFVFIGTIHSDRYKVIKKLKDSLDEKYQNFYYLFLQNKFIYYFYKLTKEEFRGTKIDDFAFEKLQSSEIADIVSKAKYIIDIQHPLQTGLTMRTLEMIGMKRKLVTTNVHIMEYDFYRPSNIQVINRENPTISDKFLDSDYEDLSKGIYEKYSIKSWIYDVLGIRE